MMPARRPGADDTRFPLLLLMRSSARLSHLMGLFYRTIRIVENGIKPAYVFDGKPPELKAGVVRLNRFPSHLVETNGARVIAGKTI